MSAVATAWAATLPTQGMELKLCEGGCNKTFVRPVPTNAKSGAKMCKACSALTVEQREAQYLRVCGIGQRVRRGGW